MSNDDYEYECSRAELLGIPRPSREEFLARKREIQNEEEIDSEDVNTEQNEEIDLQGEKIDRGAGRLDELNNILSITQKKINRFKTVCGSFTNLLKLKVGKGEDDLSETSSQQSVNVNQTGSENQEMNDGSEISRGDSSGPVRPAMATSAQNDLETKVGCQVDKLDSLISKAERAELSLSSQNKQMRHYLNK